MIQKRTTNSNPMMSVLPLRDIVVFPQMVVPLFVGREKSLSALRNVTSSEKANKELLLVAQRDAGIEDPSSDDLFDVGTVARVVQSLKLPDGTFKVLVEGIRRVRVTQYKEDEQIFAEVEDIPQDKISQRTFEPLRMIHPYISLYDGHPAGMFQHQARTSPDIFHAFPILHVK
mgnify:CR=1 FL=1